MALEISSHRRDLLEAVGVWIVARSSRRRAVIAIDGVDGAGKSTFAEQLAEVVSDRRQVIHASVDGFHHPKAVRYARGRGPLTYYQDSYDHDALRTRLIEPFRGGRELATSVFDSVTDAPDVHTVPPATPNAILIVDGIFLHRPELRGLWDGSIFLDVPFGIAIARGNARFGSDPDPAAAVNRRYVVGQRYYLRLAEPQRWADWVIDNSDLDQPRALVAPDEVAALERLRP